jgi:uncharacterized membrane protein YphA (DoxX/SURF4 family)
MASHHQLTETWWSLRIVFGSIAFLAGLDKFFDVLAPWHDYLNPAISGMVNMEPHRFLYGVGIIEMIVGAGILAGATRVGGYVGALWLLGIAINLVSMGRYYDIAVRDVGLATGMFTLARLTEHLASGGRMRSQEVHEIRRVA